LAIGIEVKCRSFINAALRQAQIFRKMGKRYGVRQARRAVEKFKKGRECDGAMYKFVAVVRTDLKLPKGKLAVQVAHAAVDAVAKTERRLAEAWRKEGGKKVVVEVAGLNELKEVEAAARKQKLVTVMISDAGRTVVQPGTVTCLGIGPDEEERMEPVTGKLKML
jgi:peptidyl-tRNA hydrolase, PTH2 family